jgi:GntR family transcriptional regulator
MTAKIIKDSANPLYKQISAGIRADIEDGTYPIDSKIPSEEELCALYDVSRITVRKALEELAEEGLLVRRQGKGTFVSVPQVDVDVKPITSFHDACRAVGKVPSTKVLSARTVKPSKEDMLELNAPADARVVEIDRVRYADGEPVILERNHFPSVYSYLLESDLSGSLYNLLRAYGIEPSKASHDVSLISADENKSTLLCVEVGSPLLFLYEVIYDQKGRPLHISHQYIRGDKFTLKI